MAGQRWQARITTTYDLADGLWLGEPVFHIEDNRFGIQGDIFTSWFPNIDLDANQFIMQSKYTITGRAGATKYVELSFDTESISVRPLYDDLQYESYNLYPAIVTFTIDEQVFKLGPDELFNNGGANSLENFLVSAKFHTRSNVLTFDSKTADIVQPEGNGFIWIKNPTREFNVSTAIPNRLAFDFGVRNKQSRESAWNAQGKAAIEFKIDADKVISPNVGRGIGYRSWVHVPNAERKRLTFSMIVVGDIGTKFATRIGYPGNFQLVLSQMTSEIQQFTFHFDPSKVNPANYGKPLAIDWMFDWHFDYTNFQANEEKRLTLACLNVVDGWYSPEVVNASYLNTMHEKTYGAFYAVYNQRAIATKAIASVLYPKPLLKDNHSIVIKSTREYTILERSKYGFNVAFTYLPDEEVEDLPFTYSAFVHGSRSDVL